jgi:phosphoribosylglycinamide formyltransferase-1
MKRVAIFISGGGSNMVTLVDAMLTGEIDAEPVLVLANSADAGGLGKARARGVSTEVVDHRNYSNRACFEAKIGEILNQYVPDVICLAGFMRVLTPEFTSKWEGKILNIHPSLLPKYKGLHTHQRALDAGDAEAGVSVHMVTAELDDGPILGQVRVPVMAGDTAEDLAARVLVEEHKLYPAVLKDLVKSL